MEKYIEQFSQAAIIFAPRLILAILTLLIGFWLANKVSNIIKSILSKKHIEPTVIPFLSSVVSTLLKVLVVISVAGMFGVETTSFVALIGGAGLAVGLALQGSLGHFASGMLILVFKPYKQGDLVSIGGFTGTVEEIQIFNTILKTLDNKKIIIPNGSITTGPITNISGQETIRVDMQYNVSGEEDIDKVRKVVQQVSDSCPLILNDPKIDILVNSQEIGITKFDVRPWCKSEHYWDVYYFMQENIKRQFVTQNVKAPKPAMDIVLEK